MSSTTRMGNLLQHVSRTAAYDTRSIARVIPRPSKLQTSSNANQFICMQCRFRSSLTNSSTRRLQRGFDNQSLFQRPRQFSARSNLRKDVKPEYANSGPDAAPSTPLDSKSDISNATPPSKASKPTVHAVPDEELPSYRERMRSRLSTRFNKLMDDLMPKLALASQRINNYTGTDYSGIAALRKEIIEQGISLRSQPFHPD
jgi:sensitive to high expression protein 9, mitochondrial